MMTPEESIKFAAVCTGRDKLSDRCEELEDARNFWRGLAIVLIVLAALDILRQWAGWTI